MPARQIERLFAVTLLFLACAWLASLACAADAFQLRDEPGQYLDILSGQRLVGRYMYAHDTSTAQKHHESYKPYLHVFAVDGQTIITKGPGGEYTHHRGIFIGWIRIGFADKTYDLWSMGGGDQVHQKFLAQAADADQAKVTSLVDWNTKGDQTLVREERTMNFRQPPAPAHVLVDFSTRLTAPSGDVMLDGDPEHGGAQYRPANELDRQATVYVFPKEKPKPTADLDYPWVGETYTLDGKRYSAVIMNHPDNPHGARFSAYRNYGRFGPFFRQPLKSGETLALKYRFLVAEGELPSAEMLQACYNQFAGTTDPVPPTTLLPAQQPAAPKPTK